MLSFILFFSVNVEKLTSRSEKLSLLQFCQPHLDAIQVFLSKIKNNHSKKNILNALLAFNMF
jgi:hypothetical protein